MEGSLKPSSLHFSLLYVQTTKKTIKRKPPLPKEGVPSDQVTVHLSLPQASKLFRFFHPIPDHIGNTYSVFASILAGFVFYHLRNRLQTIGCFQTFKFLTMFNFNVIKLSK